MAGYLKELTDAELVGVARGGNPMAFEVLVERHYGTVYMIAYGRLKHREAAEDLAQEVFLKAFLFIEKLNRPSEFGGWIARVARNLTIDWQRRGQTSSRMIQMVPIESGHEEMADANKASAAEILSNAEQEKAIMETVFKLPEIQREIVLLHLVEGLPQREIARQIAVSPSTVTRQLQRALSTMQCLLDPGVALLARSMKPRRNAKSKAVALAAAVGGLSQSARASLLTAATGDLGATTVAAGSPTSIKALLIARIPGMIVSRHILAAAAMLAIAGAASWYVYTKGRTPPSTAIPSAPSPPPWVAARTAVPLVPPGGNAQPGFAAVNAVTPDESGD